MKGLLVVFFILIILCVYRLLGCPCCGCYKDEEKESEEKKEEQEESSEEEEIEDGEGAKDFLKKILENQYQNKKE